MLNSLEKEKANKMSEEKIVSSLEEAIKKAKLLLRFQEMKKWFGLQGR